MKNSCVMWPHFTKYLFVLFLLLPSIGYAASIFDTTIVPADAKPDAYLPLLKGKKVALVINQTSVIGNVSLLDLMLKNNIHIVEIFVPEHGFRGKEDAGVKVDNIIDSATNIPVISLYGSHKKPTEKDIADVDIVVYDLQDVGLRFYTYISTLEYCMEACAEQGRQFVVLDRPNPNGFYVDGPVLEKENRSFVGMQPIPIVYGMTAGEYAAMIKGEQWFHKADSLDLTVIKCYNYAHPKKYRLPVAPSPNLRTMAAVYAYPSLCLFEGTPVSVGRGTLLPFQQFGCPGFEGKFTYSFTPHSGAGAKSPPYDNKQCFGTLIGNDENEVLREINNKFCLKWLIEAYNAYPDKEKFFTPFFVKLSGTSKLKTQIINGDSESHIRDGWKDDISAFKKIRKKYLLYPDF